MNPWNIKTGKKRRRDGQWGITVCIGIRVGIWASGSFVGYVSACKLTKTQQKCDGMFDSISRRNF